ncbi:hypothetical protein ILUMI_13533 [Ignelater luminosus]|uniref:Uncharacterized protein n=1 Tax=Ignelater luminosus TaxID=2038154 RepID=A0A8K0CYD3_IGNLU|nr:hypothetical protein ILUMI_13533 [Ignelater luminosus]
MKYKKDQKAKLAAAFPFLYAKTENASPPSSSSPESSASHISAPGRATNQVLNEQSHIADIFSQPSTPAGSSHQKKYLTAPLPTIPPMVSDMNSAASCADDRNVMDFCDGTNQTQMEDLDDLDFVLDSISQILLLNDAESNLNANQNGEQQNVIPTMENVSPALDYEENDSNEDTLNNYNPLIGGSWVGQQYFW